MSVSVLEKFLPENALPYLKIWFGSYPCHLKITKNRNSKLGDYRKLPDKSHQITVNGTLEPQLFFFVLTHELAHLIGFNNLIQICRYWDGDTIYIPLASDYAQFLRDEKIKQDSATLSNDQLAKKYSVSNRWIREIKRRQREPEQEKKKDDRQIDMFGF